MVSQPRPAIIEKSPFYELSEKYKVEIAYKPFIRVVGVSLKEFRAQRVEILTHTAVIFTSRTTVDSFFHICEEARITVPETMKYICQTEAVALYLQKYIVYRKRKISFADGSFTSFIELIIKHKDEKFLLALSEPHKPELPETLAKLKMSFDPAILARTVAADMDDIALELLGELAEKYPQYLTQRYGITDFTEKLGMYEALCRRRGFVLKGGEFDYERGAKALIDDFRKGRVGKVCLERADEYRNLTF